MAFVQKHTSVISSDRTQMTIKNANSSADFTNNGMTFPPEAGDGGSAITIVANNRVSSDNTYVLNVQDGSQDYYGNGLVIEASDLGWDYTLFNDDVYSVTVGCTLITNPPSDNPDMGNLDLDYFSESTNVVMADSEDKYFKNVLAYQKSQNYNPIVSTRFNYLNLDSLYKSLKYAEQMNLIPSCIKLLDTFKKALL